MTERHGVLRWRVAPGLGGPFHAQPRNTAPGALPVIDGLCAAGAPQFILVALNKPAAARLYAWAKTFTHRRLDTQRPVEPCVVRAVEQELRNGRAVVRETHGTPPLQSLLLLTHVLLLFRYTATSKLCL